MSSNLAQATFTYTIGDFEETYNLLKCEDKYRPKVLSMLGASCFFTGRFEEALDIYNRLFIEQNIYSFELGCDIRDYDDLGRKIYKILKSIGVDRYELPKIENYNYPQSIEKSNEQYPELEEISYLICNANTPSGCINYNNFIEKLLSDMKSSDNKKRAQAYLNASEIHYRKAEFDQAFECYLGAINSEPSKALYYGYAAQTIIRTKKLIPLMSIFTRRAIDLDPENAKWHMLHGISCLNLSKIFQVGEILNISKMLSDNFFATANLELQKALDCCRPDQVSLRRAIEKVIGGIRK